MSRDDFNRLLQQRPFDGHWCIREHVTHFFDAQAVLIQRVLLILKEDTPMLSSAAPYETATNLDAVNHLTIYFPALGVPMRATPKAANFTSLIRFWEKV
jgi:hypothetical protein